MEEKIAILSRSLLFSGLPDSQLRAVASICHVREHGRSEMIFFEGDPGQGFYIVAQGRVKIYKTNPLGKEHILHIFGPGEPFGEVPVFHGRPFPANAQAIEKSRTLFLPRQDFVELMAATPSLALNMLAVLALRLRSFTSQVEALSLKEVPVRLAEYLLYLGQEQGGGDEVRLEISKGQLASLLGTVPATLSRILARMSEQGLIEVEGPRIRLLDKEGLKQQ